MNHSDDKVKVNFLFLFLDGIQLLEVIRAPPEKNWKSQIKS
jgi:hypothetical protein